MNRTTKIAYNPAGQVTSITDPLGNPPQTFAYDINTGDLTATTDPFGNRSKFTTDSIGRVLTSTTALRETTSYNYNALDELTFVTDGNGSLTQYKYDLLGNVIQITDANNRVTTITRPATLDTVTTCDPANHCEIVNKDVMGRRTIYTDKRGVKDVYTYDVLGRLTKAVFNSANKSPYDQRTITYTYDANDRVTNISDTGGGIPGIPGNTIAYTYDGVDDLMTEQTSPGATVSYHYDAAGKQTTMTAGSQPGVTYSYYNDDQLNTITTTNATASFTYDGDGRPSVMTVNNVSANKSVTTGYGYDVASRLTSISYTATGNVNLGNLTYAYDQDGRILTKGGSLAGVTFPPVMSAGYLNTNQIQSWNGLNATADNANNLTLNPLTSDSYTWDSKNELSTITNGNYSFLYDANGRREYATALGYTTGYLHDGVATAQASPNNTVQDFFYGPAGVMAFSTTAGKPSTTTTQIPIQDALGSTLGLVDSSGAMVTQYSYDSFGNATASGQASTYPFLFAGMESDTSGLYHTQSRYYSPTLQRFLSEDPLRFGGGSTNLFTYGLNNPVSNVDPLGQDVCPGGDCAGGGGGQQPTVFVPPGLVDQIFNPISWFESLFDFLFGGGGHQQVVIPRKLRHRPHIIFAQYSGLSRDLIVAQADEDDERESTGEEPMGVFLGKLYWRYKLRNTLDRIAKGIKLPYRNDGSIFQNREGRLPAEPSGYYREYVHPTPGVSGPGPQRIVTGASGEIYYTPDHYEHFLQLR